MLGSPAAGFVPGELVRGLAMELDLEVVVVLELVLFVMEGWAVSPGIAAVVRLFEAAGRIGSTGGQGQQQEELLQRQDWLVFHEKSSFPASGQGRNE